MGAIAYFVPYPPLHPPPMAKKHLKLVHMAYGAVGAVGIPIQLWDGGGSPPPHNFEQKRQFGAPMLHSGIFAISAAIKFKSFRASNVQFLNLQSTLQNYCQWHSAPIANGIRGQGKMGR